MSECLCANTSMSTLPLHRKQTMKDRYSVTESASIRVLDTKWNPKLDDATLISTTNVASPFHQSESPWKTEVRKFYIGLFYITSNTHSGLNILIKFTWFARIRLSKPNFPEFFLTYSSTNYCFISLHTFITSNDPLNSMWHKVTLIETTQKKNK